MRNPNDPYGDYTQDGSPGTTPDPYGTIKQPSAPPTGANPGGSPYTTQPSAPPQPGPTSWQNVTPAPGSIADQLGKAKGTPAPPGYTRNPDGTLTFTGYNPATGQISGKPTLLTNASPPGHAAGTAPSYVDQSDPTQAAVYAAFQKKGIDPRDQSDFQYWVDKINSTNGGWSNPDNQKFWLSRMDQASGGVGDYGGGAEAGAGSTSTNQSDPFLRQALLDRLNQLQKPIDPNSAAIAGPAAAYNLTADRGAQTANQDLAEQAYAKGTLNTGGYDQSQQQALETTTANKSNFVGGLMSQADQQRQAALDSLLATGSGQGLTEELAGGTLGYQYAALKAAMDRDAMLASLGYYGG